MDALKKWLIEVGAGILFEYFKLKHEYEVQKVQAPAKTEKDDVVEKEIRESGADAVPVPDKWVR